VATLIALGTQWGDEGKGRIVDVLAEHADFVVRYQGGGNAGHTIVADGAELTVRQVPAGILRETTCVLGNGVALDPGRFLDEVDGLRARGIRVTPDNLVVSDRAHVTLPYHLDLDAPNDPVLQAAGLATTHHGIRPTYVDKVGRTGIRVSDLFDEELLRQKLSRNLEQKSAVLGAKARPIDELFELCCGWAEQAGPFVRDTVRLLNQALDADKSVVFEGAQATGLDIDLGTYPFVTSSHTTAGGACIGTGVSPRRIDRVLGIAKAYITKVGDIDPFPSAMTEQTENDLRSQLGESGGTEQNRIGWFDVEMVRYAAMVNGIDALAITKLDALDGVESPQICVGYEYQGRRLEGVVSDQRALTECRPVLEAMPGWGEPTTEARRFEDLPENARRYVERIAALCDLPIAILTVGRDRSATIIGDASYVSRGIA